MHPGELLTTVRFPDSGDVTVLDTDGLRAGELDELATIEDATAEVVPVGEFVLLAGDDGVARLVSPTAPADELATTGATIRSGRSARGSAWCSAVPMARCWPRSTARPAR